MNCEMKKNIQHSVRQDIETKNDRNCDCSNYHYPSYLIIHTIHQRNSYYLPPERQDSPPMRIQHSLFPIVGQAAARTNQKKNRVSSSQPTIPNHQLSAYRERQKATCGASCKKSLYPRDCISTSSHVTNSQLTASVLINLDGQESIVPLEKAKFPNNSPFEY